MYDSTYFVMTTYCSTVMPIKLVQIWILEKEREREEKRQSERNRKCERQEGEREINLNVEETEGERVRKRERERERKLRLILSFNLPDMLRINEGAPLSASIYQMRSSPLSQNTEFIK